MLIVAVMMIASGREFFENGISGFIDQLNTIDPKLTQTTNETSFLFRDYFEIIFAQIVIGVAIVCQPHIITKSLMLKNPSKVNMYLLSSIFFMSIYFLVVFVGLYARLTFPDLTIDGKPLKMDEIIPTYVVTKFSAAAGVLVVVGLISAGLSTLESLIQSLSITITTDIIETVVPKSKENSFLINKVVIVLLAIVSFILSWEQIQHPALSVAIFAQNGVYAYFAAAFVPVLFGTFFKQVPVKVVFIASVVALVAHFGIYYLHITPYIQETVNNPGVSAAIAI